MAATSAPCHITRFTSTPIKHQIHFDGRQADVRLQSPRRAAAEPEAYVRPGVRPFRLDTTTPELCATKELTSKPKPAAELTAATGVAAIAAVELAKSIAKTPTGIAASFTPATPQGTARNPTQAAAVPLSSPILSLAKRFDQVAGGPMAVEPSAEAAHARRTELQLVQQDDAASNCADLTAVALRWLSEALCGPQRVTIEALSAISEAQAVAAARAVEGADAAVAALDGAMKIGASDSAVALLKENVNLALESAEAALAAAAEAKKERTSFV